MARPNGPFGSHVGRHLENIGLGVLDQLCAVESEGVEGVICGRAIYSGDLDFAAAQARADELALG